MQSIGMQTKERIASSEKLPTMILIFLFTLLAVLSIKFSLFKFYTLGISILFLFYCLFRLYLLVSISNWKQVEAKINHYGLINHRIMCNEPKSIRDEYEIEVSYSYHYKNKVYKSNKIAISKTIYIFKGNKNRAIQYLENLLNETNLCAYINPFNPSKSVLKKEISKKELWDYGIGILTVVIANIAIWYLF